MARILYITYDGLTDPLGQSQIIPYLQGLAKLGDQITILSTEKKERYRRKHKIINSILAEAQIQWEHIFYHKKPPVISTLLDVRKLSNKASVLSRKNHYDIVHCRSYLSSLIGLRLKRKIGIKFIFDMRGFWADERVDGKLWNLKNPIFRSIYNYFKRKEKAFLFESDAIISLTEAGKTEIERWQDSDRYKNKINVIPCCVDTVFFDPGSINDSTQKEKWTQLELRGNEFILTYLGSIGTWYMLDEMLEFFISLKKVRKNAKMLFITPETDHERIFTGTNQHNLSKGDIRIIEADRKDVPVYLSISDFSIFFIKPSYSKISSSPTKQGEIMALGIPVICNEGVGDTSEIITRYKSGISIKELDTYHFSKAIKQMGSTSFDKKALRKGAIDYYSLDKGVAEYYQIYQTLTS